MSWTFARSFRIHFRLFALLLWWSIMTMQAQQPVHERLGEAELAGRNIYDILHTSAGDYVITTDAGLVRYEGYEFARIACPELIPKALFGLVERRDGTVFAHNLAGQVMAFKDGKASIHYTLPDSLLSADMRLLVANDQSLLMAARRCVVISNQGKAILLDDCGRTSQIAENRVVMYNNQSLQWKEYANKTWHPLPWTGLNDKDDYPILFESSSDLLAFEHGANTLHRLGENNSFAAMYLETKQHLKGAAVRFYGGNTGIWMALGTTGALAYDNALRPMFGTNPIFQDQFISVVEEDGEGNILLGTFGEGIILIRNTDVQLMKGPASGDKMLCFDIGPDGTKYIGTRAGMVYAERDGIFTPVRSKGKKSIEYLFLLHDRYLVMADAQLIIRDLKSGRERLLNAGALKDAAEGKDNTLLLATSKGAYRFDPATDTITQLPEMNLRSYKVEADTVNQTVFVATAKGLFTVVNDAEVHKSTQANQWAITEMVSGAGGTFLSTIEHGVMATESGQDWVAWYEPTDDKAQVFDMLIEAETIYLLTGAGISLLNHEGQKLGTLTGVDGVNTGGLVDFKLINDSLYLLYPEGIHKVNAAVAASPPAFRLSLASVRVNDSIDIVEENGTFGMAENNLEFELQVTSFKYQNEIIYEYQLLGTSQSHLRRNPYPDHIIKYASLAPGEYEFKARATCRGMAGPWTTYSFKISEPFWMRWWFYALVVVGVSLLMFLIYRQRLRRQTRELQKENEVNASKLTAIRAQMNPHFIFNALNSIQALVLKGDIENSYSYITKFAQLVRKTLNYSAQELVEFREELDLIEIYLALEQLRFSDDFSYEISRPESDEFKLPPMILQPFIENALVHGLLHKAGEKRLKLRFEFHGEEVLRCWIIDNGIGRAKAHDISERKQDARTSFSVKAIERRLGILSKAYNDEFRVVYRDIMDNETCVGTEVKVDIPIRWPY